MVTTCVFRTHSVLLSLSVILVTTEVLGQWFARSAVSKTHFQLWFDSTKAVLCPCFCPWSLWAGFQGGAKLSTTWGSGGLRIQSLLFVDDVVLLASSSTYLQLVLVMVCGPVWMSTYKSEAVVLSWDWMECPLQVGEEIQFHMEEFEYLGGLVHQWGVKWSRRHRHRRYLQWCGVIPVFGGEEKAKLQGESSMYRSVFVQATEMSCLGRLRHCSCPEWLPGKVFQAGL